MATQQTAPWRRKTIEDPVCVTCSGSGGVGESNRQPCGKCGGDGRVYGKATLEARRKVATEIHDAEDTAPDVKKQIEEDETLDEEHNV